jgi:hypothetical protein
VKAARHEPRARAPAIWAAPSVFIAVGWVALWLLWPFQLTAERRGRPAVPPAVGFVGDAKAAPWYVEPDWFASPSRPGFGMPDVTTAVDSTTPDPSKKIEPRFYARTMSVDEPGVVEPVASETNREYRLRAERRRVFTVPGETPAVVAVMSPALVACGYVLPVFDDERLTGHGKPWQVVARVELAEDGATESVMVEMGCDDPVINATIARCLHRAKADRPAGRCSGRVTVSGRGG